MRTLKQILMVILEGIIAVLSFLATIFGITILLFFPFFNYYDGISFLLIFITCFEVYCSILANIYFIRKLSKDEWWADSI